MDLCAGQAGKSDDLNIDWGQTHEPIQPPGGEYIDLEKELGVRFYLRESEDRAKLYGQFHHVCCGGLRGLDIMDDLLTAYATLHPNTLKKPSWRPIKKELIAARGKFKFGRLTRVIMWAYEFGPTISQLTIIWAGRSDCLGKHGVGVGGGRCSVYPRD